LKDLEQLLFRLCEAPGTPGAESPAAKAAAAELADMAKVKIDRMGNVLAEFGDPDAAEHVLLDAHLDQIGLIVTDIDEQGFLKVARCGGTDARVLPGSAVTVYGRETLCGVVCSTPPHLQEGGEDKVPAVDKMAVDVGLSYDEAKKLVQPGDRILFRTGPKRLLGNTCVRCGIGQPCQCCGTLPLCTDLKRRKTALPSYRSAKRAGRNRRSRRENRYIFHRTDAGHCG
jgi:putative aminopeptidase FrvX